MDLPIHTKNEANAIMMDWRNRIGLYGSYFLGMAAIGFTLPYLPLYLGEKGLSDRAIGLISTLAALSALAQFPVGLWSDRIGWRKPFLVIALAVAASLDGAIASGALDHLARLSGHPVRRERHQPGHR